VQSQDLEVMLPIDKGTGPRSRDIDGTTHMGDSIPFHLAYYHPPVLQSCTTLPAPTPSVSCEQRWYSTYSSSLAHIPLEQRPPPVLCSSAHPHQQLYAYAPPKLRSIDPKGEYSSTPLITPHTTYNSAPMMIASGMSSTSTGLDEMTALRLPGS